MKLGCIIILSITTIIYFISPELAAWKGLKLTCSEEGFEDFTIKKSDYMEEGARVLEYL